MQLAAALVALLPVITAASACGPSSSAPVPSVSATPPPSGRRLFFGGSAHKCMIAKGRYPGAPVGISTDCINAVPNMIWDHSEYTFGSIRLQDTNLCIDAGDYATRGDGNKVTLQTCQPSSPGNNAQYWYYALPNLTYPNGVELGGPHRANGYPPRTNLCLDLTDGNPGGQLQTWTCYPGNMNQKFDWE